MHRTAPVSLDTIDFQRAKNAINAAIDKVLDDVIQRPGLDAKRTVTLKIDIVPEMDKTMTINTPNIDWAVTTKMPGDAGMTSKALVQPDNTVLVNIDDELFDQHALVGRNGDLHTDDGVKPPEADNVHKLAQR